MDENIFLSYRGLERPRWKEKEEERGKKEEGEKECRKRKLKKDKS